MRNKKIKVLIVDDSAVVRRILSASLAKHPDIEVVGAAHDPYDARDMILKLKPDVLTLDIEMPRMSGLEFVSVLMQHYPIPIVIVSSLVSGRCETSLKALELGAVEIFAKPSLDLSRKLPVLMADLYQKIIAASAAKVFKREEKQINKEIISLAKINATDKIIAIGASTGGTQAIQRVLERLPNNLPPIIMSQHMPPGFTRSYADRLNSICKMEVREAENNDLLHPGLALLAPGDFHLLLKRDGARYRVNVKTGPKVCRQRPSVDVMFLSVAEAAGRNAIGVILTGMGADGADGLLKMRENGAKTVAQSEKSCVVYGMPREAALRGAAEYVDDLDRIPERIINILSGKPN